MQRTHETNAKRLLRPGDDAWELICHNITEMLQTARRRPEDLPYLRRKLGLELWRPTADVIVGGAPKLGRSMPTDWDQLDPWARYRKAGLTLTLPVGSAL